MMTQEKFEKIQQAIEPISTISMWLLPKTLKLFLLGLMSIAWLVFYSLQFWSWHYVWLLPIAILLIPLLIMAIWSLMLWDLTDLPEALEKLKNGVLGVKERVTGDKQEAFKVVVRVSQARKLPFMLKELWGMVEGVDAIRTVVGHTLFLANPVSWGLLVLAIIAITFYILSASISFMFWLF
jgi:hypothetical protein